MVKESEQRAWLRLIEKKLREKIEVDPAFVQMQHDLCMHGTGAVYVAKSGEMTPLAHREVYGRSPALEPCPAPRPKGMWIKVWKVSNCKHPTMWQYVVKRRNGKGVLRSSWYRRRTECVRMAQRTAKALGIEYREVRNAKNKAR